MLRNERVLMGHMTDQQSHCVQHAAGKTLLWGEYRVK